MKVSQVLVHSIGPNGVIAEVVGECGDRVKVRYYDARDGGTIERWVHTSEVAVTSIVFKSKREAAMGRMKTSVSKGDVDTLITSVFTEYLKLCEIQNNYDDGEVLSDTPRNFVIATLERLSTTCAAAAQDFRQAQTDVEHKRLQTTLLTDDPDTFYNMSREDKANGWP